MTAWLWVTFFFLVIAMVAIDLGVVTRRPRTITQMDATASVALWVLGALGFGLLLAMVHDRHWLNITWPAAQALSPHDVWLQYITAYCVELALSLDNVAVLALVLAAFKIDPAFRSRLLFWTIILSLVLRAVLIQLGVVLLQWGWMNWVFAGLLVLATVRIFTLPDDSHGLETRMLVKLARRLPVLRGKSGQQLVVFVDGRIRITPFLAACAVAVAADLSCALDSIPGVFAVTRQPLIAVASNAFALMALRSLYFLLADLLERPRFLKISLTIVLLGLAVKTIISRFDDSATALTLASVIGIVGLGMMASVMTARRARRAAARPTPLQDVAEAVAVSKRNLRKLVILIVGTIILLLAVVIAPLPGPGFVILAPIGLAVLGTEFLWARAILKRLQEQTAALQNRTEKLAASSHPWMIPPVVLGYWALIALAARYGPVAPRMVWLASIGGFLPVLYWAVRTVRRRMKQKGSPRKSGRVEVDR